MNQSNPAIARLARVVVVLAACLGAGGATADGPVQPRIGEVLPIPIPGGVTCDATVAGVQLLLNGLDTGLRPLGCDPANNALMFRLARRDVQGDVDVAWSVILGDPWKTPKGDFVRSFQVTLAKPDPATGVARSIATQSIQLTIVRKGWLIAGFSLIALAWIGLILAGMRSGMLRDSNSTASGTGRPYSLARVQMAWWFALVIGAYVFLWALTDDLALMNSSVLALIGISGATGLTAAGIDNAGDRQVPKTEGFFHDILTDASGITLPRLQLLLWNVVLGVIFLERVFSDLRMPAFDATTLGLLGISAGAYVGFKVPEKQINPADAASSLQKIDKTDPKAGYTPE